MTLQIFGWEKEGSLVQPFGTGVAKQFPFDTINGKTGDASGGPITIKQGDRVRIRIYNASQQTHAHDRLSEKSQEPADEPSDGDRDLGCPLVVSRSGRGPRGSVRRRRR